LQGFARGSWNANTSKAGGWFLHTVAIPRDATNHEPTHITSSVIHCAANNSRDFTRYALVWLLVASMRVNRECEIEWIVSTSYAVHIDSLTARTIVLGLVVGTTVYHDLPLLVETGLCRRGSTKLELTDSGFINNKMRMSDRPGRTNLTMWEDRVFTYLHGNTDNVWPLTTPTNNVVVL